MAQDKGYRLSKYGNVSALLTMNHMSFVLGCPNIADIAIAMDASGSIEKPNFFVMQDFVRDLVYGINLDAGARVAILLFATKAQVEIPLNAYNTTAALLNAMNFRYTGGTTNTAEALRIMRNQV